MTERISAEKLREKIQEAVDRWNHLVAGGADDISLRKVAGFLQFLAWPAISSGLRVTFSEPAIMGERHVGRRGDPMIAPVPMTVSFEIIS